MNKKEFKDMIIGFLEKNEDLLRDDTGEFDTVFEDDKLGRARVVVRGLLGTYGVIVAVKSHMESFASYGDKKTMPSGASFTDIDYDTTGEERILTVDDLPGLLEKASALKRERRDCLNKVNAIIDRFAEAVKELDRIKLKVNRALTLDELKELSEEFSAMSAKLQMVNNGGEFAEKEKQK